MALRYLLRIGQTPNSTRAFSPDFLAKSGLSILYSDQRTVLACNQEECWSRFADGNGLVVGSIFRRDRFSQFPVSANGETIAMDADVHAVLTSLWGAFVAVILGASSITVTRDPSGLLPAYYARYDGDWYFASDVSVLVEAGIIAPSVDWEGLGRALYANELPEERTSLLGVRQLLPGMAVECAEDGARASMVWTPWTHVNSRPLDDEQLRRLIISCLHAWGSRFDRALIGVSGGLDSSIAAAGLRRSTELHGITISTRDAQGDEALYARALCDRLGITLAEECYSLDRVDIERSSYAHCPRPGGRAQLQAYDAAMLDVAHRLGTEAFFTGVGGDNIFQFTKSARPLVDRYLAQGIGLHLFSTLSDICRLTGANAFRVIREAAKVPRSGTQKYLWVPDERFLSKDAIAAAATSRLSHPWLEGPTDSLPGKAAHIAFLIRTQHYMDVHDRRWPTSTLHPLLSLPIIEACLAMPSWTACAGGVDRAYARRSFAADLPTETLTRSVKNGPDGFAHAIIRHHLSRIRERLLDGELAQRNILDREKLDAALKEQQIARGDDYPRILLLLDTEAWAEGWSAGSPASRQT
ncbi:asparagine synthase-related protein [Sphingobium lactosutens]|uniref:asparagine synthase (glutamine-hydrolyzing) n=1 Tax=Sphingobium lactosutens DS20 TaxID=1331060 RepID=T0HEF2_9SPHN|nr:asparagine synthase-related protein [Sphingobium lactosutens]EQB11377.1 hypothetical protein RLDS_23530 [Sphingobium lactosutens DS20]